MRRAVFLDRDGVVNRAFVRDGKPFPPTSEQQLEILPGVPAALEALRERGFLLIVVTNQPDVSRGTVTRGLVAAINARLQRELPLSAILTCFHDSADACDCRKPLPGLLLQAARQWDVDLSSSYMVGDRASDVAAGARAGCATLFIDRGYSEPAPPEYDFRVQSLTEAAAIIIGRDGA